MSDLPFVVRPAHAGDAPFVLNSWLKSFRESKMVRGIPAEVYFLHQHEVCEAVLERATTLVLCADDDMDTIVGWICFEEQVGAVFVHFMYVKNGFRCHGLGRQLFETAKTVAEKRVGPCPATFVTHPTMKCRQVSWMKTWIYNPYAAWRLAK